MHRQLTRRPILSGLAACFALASPLAMAGTVTNCNDHGAGSLRSAIAAAVSGETIDFDLAAMACNAIPLTTGQLQVDVQDLTLQGPTSGNLVIIGLSLSRLINDGVGGGSPDRSRTLTISNLSFTNGYYASGGTIGGGCIEADGDLRLSHVQLYDCEVYNRNLFVAGGAVSSHTLHMYDSSISNSRATSDSGLSAIGGGAFVTGDTTIVRSTISGNLVDNGRVSADMAKGGGVAVQPDGDASISIVASTISYNTAPHGTGGGLFIKGATGTVSVSIERGAILFNSAYDAAGAYLVSFNGAVTLVNSTISSNQATHAAGGAIARGQHNTFINDTIAYNKAAVLEYGAFRFPAAVGLTTYAPRLVNTIIAKNTLPDLFDPPEWDFHGGGATGSHNIIPKPYGSTTPPDTIVDDPMLDSLADNGGPTWTYALLDGSPAIDAGTICVGGTLPATDQRGSGFPRIWGAHPDIGAYESGEPAGGDVIFRAGMDNAACPP